MRARPDFDLNLLVVLDALLSTRSVTRAAGKLGMGQPAVSGALARLRRMLGDPLFVRGAGGMVPTPRALAMEKPIRATLHAIDRELAEDAAFDAKTSTRTFVVAATDYVQFVVLGRLLHLLRREAPSVTLRVLPVVQRFPWRDLETGDLDLVLGRAPQRPEGLRRRPLFNDRIVGVLRHDHPHGGASLDLAGYLALEHIDVLPIESPGLADVYLQRVGKRRRLVATMPHFVVAPFVIPHTDCCLALSERVAKELANQLPLRIVELPFPAPVFTVHAYWHERVQDDAGHRFLRGLAHQAASAG